MTITQRGTCTSCGYEKPHCICKIGEQIGTIYPRNTHGSRRMYQNYQDFRNVDDYAMTARINRTSSEDRKIMEELLPVDGESLLTYFKRTGTAEQKLIEHSIQHHLYGTKRVWACHTSSRYCFICTMAQFLNVSRTIIESLPDIVDLSTIFISVTVDDSGEPPLLGLFRKED